MARPQNCPICLNAHGGRLRSFGPDGLTRFDIATCDVCGEFAITREAYADFLDPLQPGSRRFSAVSRARLSHRVRTSSDLSPTHIARIDSDALQRFLDDGAPGPTPIEQARNIVRFIGDHVASTGEPLREPPLYFYAAVGSPTPMFAGQLMIELQEAGIVTGHENRPMQGAWGLIYAGLSLAGWQRYEAERHGRAPGDYAFIALPFREPGLDRILNQVMKPAIATLGFTLIDMRDVQEAGVIDNLMRMRIRDAAFVLADLTHGNNGAYWEAGFAEGLGKPVIYLCEKAKFEETKTHFDTNHCTTVVWDSADPTKFADELIATVRNSLKLFSG